MRLDADTLIKKFNDLPMHRFPETGQQVVVNGDRWAGEMVVRVTDLAHLLSDLIEATRVP